MRSVWLHLARPEIPTCQDCQTWVHDDRWRRTEYRLVRGGPKIPLPNFKGITPCVLCPKSIRSPDGSARPNPGADLAGRNWQALQLYTAVRAGAPMPDDGIAVKNCALIQGVVDQYERQQREAAIVSADVILALAGARRG